MNFNYYMPSRIAFGPKSLEQLGTVALPGKKALIVISAGPSMRKIGALDRVVALLKQNGAESVIFEKIQPNPTKTHVMEGAALARKEGCDFIVGLGGGSSLDSAKSIAVMATNPGDYWDYVGGGSGKAQPLVAKPLPMIAITTTAGTGTEADPWTVITKEETNEKIGYGCDDTFPVFSIVDPELMVSVPPHLTAYQGFDALFHAIEGYIANIASPMSDMFALKSIETIAKWLPVAVKDGANLEARSQMAFANMLSGFVESTSCCTSEHSLEHAMSAFHPDLPHGAGLVMVSRGYYPFFIGKIPDTLFVTMARAMGESVDSLPVVEQPKAFLNALNRLINVCGLGDLKMSDYGITREELPALAQNARDTMWGLFELDRYKLSLEETTEILRQAWR